MKVWPFVSGVRWAAFFIALLFCSSGVVLSAAAEPVEALSPSAAQAVSSAPVMAETVSFESALKASLATLSGERARRKPQALEGFYAARSYRPYWILKGAPRSEALWFLEYIKSSWKQGLNPNSYYLTRIEGSLDSGHMAMAELLLSEAYLRLGRDLGGIRIDPKPLETQKSYWKQPPSAETLLTHMAETERDIKAGVEALAPQGQTYKRLQEELTRLLTGPAPDYDAVLPLKFRGILNPYERDGAVPALRVRLGLAAPEAADPLVYDDALAAAVIRFQRESGLKADGIIGGQTLGILNLTRRHKIEQIIANLERLRWVDEHRPSKIVVVNIPSATLWAIEDNKVAFEMPVIVGRKKRLTNMFTAKITGVRLNPDWTVPPTIKKEDILPKLQENPDYLSQKGMELVTLAGERPRTLDPLAVNWNDISPSELSKLRMVQIPGAHNPLGQVRVLMPNIYNIYLHDTNQPEYFDKAGRAQSSGCVRMSAPKKMAEFILKERPGWKPEDTESLLRKGTRVDLSIPEPIPVYMLYYTVWVGENGQVVFGNDLYGHDAALMKMLRAIDGIFLPVNNESHERG
ncbi:MAG: L,D-transpeptidase family protein [Alphaproteobacteria bacterium]|nr:L,D-transpeptidase family protein [Alphaproteobacteria bacterium]